MHLYTHVYLSCTHVYWILQIVQNGQSKLSSYGSHARVLASLWSVFGAALKPPRMANRPWKLEVQHLMKTWRHWFNKEDFCFQTVAWEASQDISGRQSKARKKSATTVYMYMYIIYIYCRLIDSLTLIHLSSLPSDDSHRSTVHFSATMSAAWKNLTTWSWSSITLHHNTANIDK